MPGLDLLSQMISEPAFEQEKLELARQLKNEELRRIEDDPQKLAFREFNRLHLSLTIRAAVTHRRHHSSNITGMI